MNDVVLETGVDVPEELFGEPVLITFEEICCNPNLEFLKTIAYDLAVNKKEGVFEFDAEKGLEIMLSMFELTPVSENKFTLKYREMNFEEEEISPQQMELDLSE